MNGIKNTAFSVQKFSIPVEIGICCIGLDSKNKDTNQVVNV